MRTLIDGKEIFFDFADDSEYIAKERPSFKFHYRGGEKNMYAFAPPSFYNWDEYFALSEKLKYKAVGYISNRQTPYGNGIERRRLTRTILNTIGGGEYKLMGPSEYLKDMPNCLVSVCAPGQNAHILDRGQFQYMGLGACTISPSLPEILPFNKVLIPGAHYIECKEDFSDLLDKVEWCKSNTQGCIEIGQNAKKLFQETSTPAKVVQWVRENI